MSEDDDQLFKDLASLPQVAADVQWEARVRARAHAAISRRAARRVQDRGVGVLDLAGAAALCIYLAVSIAEALRLVG